MAKEGEADNKAVEGHNEANKEDVEANKAKGKGAAAVAAAKAPRGGGGDTAGAGTGTTEGTTTTTVIVKGEEEASEGTSQEAQPAATSSSNGAVAVSPAEQTVQGGQQIYIIQTTDGSIPMETAEVVVADDMAVYETVSALEQLSRGNVVTTATTGEGGELIQVCFLVMG